MKQRGYSHLGGLRPQVPQISGSPAEILFVGPPFFGSQGSDWVQIIQVHDGLWYLQLQLLGFINQLITFGGPTWYRWLPFTKVEQVVECDALMRLLVHFRVILFKYNNFLIYMKYSIDGSMIGRLYIEHRSKNRYTWLGRFPYFGGIP